MKKGFVEQIQNIAFKLPPFDFLIYTKERIACANYDGTNNFRLACEVANAQGDPNIIQSVKDAENSIMEIEREPYHITFDKLMQSIRDEKLAHCQDCRNTYELISEELIKVPIETRFDYIEKIKLLKFCKTVNVTDSTEYTDEYLERIIEIQNLEKPKEPHIFAIRYFHQDNDEFQTQVWEENVDELAGGNYILDLLNK